MSDKKLIQLEKIKYKNEDYQVFSDIKGRRIFFKIENDGTYIYPDIKVYLELDKIYNHNDITIVYSKKDIKRKLIEGTLIVANITLLSLNVYNLVKDDLIENKIIQSGYQSYNRIDYNTAISLSYQSEDAFEILKNNQNISEEDKEYIKKFIICLNDLKPSLNLNIFKTNLKTLKIIKVSADEFKKEHGENVKACFDSTKKTIFYSDEYDLEETIYHELSHLTTVIYFEDKNLLYHVEGDNGFGNALYEGFNTVFTNSLLDKQDEAYTKEQCYVKIISEIIGSKKLEECYFGDGDIVEELSKYDKKEEVTRIIMLMDDLCNTEDVKEIDTKKTESEIAKKLIEWSRISAKEKYYNLKDKSTYDYDLDQACRYQLMNTSSLLSLAFSLSLDQIKELEQQVKYDDPIFKEYKNSLENDPNHFEKLKEQFRFVYYKKYFLDYTIDQFTFERIAEEIKDYNK